MARIAKASKKSISVRTRAVASLEHIRPDMPRVRVGDQYKDYKRLLWEEEYDVHYNVALADQATAFVKYCEKHFDKKQASVLKRLPDYDFIPVGKWAYLANRGLVLTDDRLALMRQRYEEMVPRAVALKEKADVDEQVKAEQDLTALPKLSIQDRMRQQVDGLCALWDEKLDMMVRGKLALTSFEPFTDLKVYQNGVIKPAHAKLIKEAYANQQAEAKIVALGKDAEVLEYYSIMSAKQRKDFAGFYDKLMSACDALIGAGKATRKARAPKPKDKMKQIAKLKFKANDPALGLASITPSEILGAQALWIFNTKSRKLGVYVADPLLGGLSVKGTSLVGYDEAKSVCKTVRKPEALLKGCIKLPRTKFQKMLEEIKGVETAMNGRLNEHIILLKAF